jgi:RNA polymerase sigma-70 factor (ECF subfamily)
MPTEGDLKELMLLSLDGDRLAYRRLLSALADLLRRRLRRQLGSMAFEVEDILQECLLAIHHRRESFDVGRPLLPWVYAIASFKLADFHRARFRRKTASLDDMDDIAAAGQDQRLDAELDVRSLLGRLPARSAGPIRDVKIDGLSIEEAAVKNGLSKPQIKMIIHRGLRSLMAVIEGEGRR